VRGLVALLAGGAHFRLAALPVFVFDVRQLVLVLAHEDLLSNHLVVARAVVAGRPRTIARLFLDSFRITPVWLLYRQIDFT